jgi:hypothetical protein
LIVSNPQPFQAVRLTYSACVCKTLTEERANHCTKEAEDVFMADLVEYEGIWMDWMLGG